MRKLSLSSLALLVLLFASSARADEGMWTVNNFPRELVKERYGFAPTDAWIEHLRLSSVRFNSGGSGSFVSPTGLVMTNHHVGGDCIAKLGRSDHDYHRDGFFARSAADEIKCPDLELNVLIGIEDVTAEVATMQLGPDGKAASEAAVTRARKERILGIEKRCAEKTGARCDVVTLYRGGRYDLYRYKKYSDVRLVFAPEFAIAFFGGDADNFTFPRYDLDVAFFRVYEGGKALSPAHYLRWSATGAREGELVFTSGHPGATQRLATLAMLETLRDLSYPYTLAELERLRTLLMGFGARGPEAERSARKLLFSVENSRKARTGQLGGLKDAALMAKKTAAETRLKAAIASRPGLGDAALAFGAIERAEKVHREIALRYDLLEGRPARAISESNPFGSRLFGIARAVVRMVDEASLPSEKRLRELGEAGRASYEMSLYSTAPIDLELEEALLASSLERLAKRLGPTDAVVKRVLDGKTPALRARELVRGCKLADVAVRRQLAAGRAAQDAAKDPMVALARAIDPEARALRRRMEEEVEGPEESALGHIARAQLAVEGAQVPPDATFTLRISFGKVLGYTEGERPIPPMTVLAGLYARSQKAKDQPPYQLPARWVAAKSKLRPLTPMNLVSTNDIIGGNSGSPLVNQAGELVGLIFDGNIHSLPNSFIYGDRLDRALSVHTLGLQEALRKVYDAGSLVDELVVTKAVD